MLTLTQEDKTALYAKDGKRVEKYYARIFVDKALTAVVPCGGTVDLDATADIERTASLELYQPLDLLKVEIQPVAEIGGIPYPLGRFLASTPTQSSDGYRDIWKVECYDRTLILQEDKLLRAMTIPKGKLYLDAVGELMVSAGIDEDVIQDESAAALPIDRTFEAGTAKLSIINTLLDEINFNKLRCDAEGTFVISAYTDQTRTPAGISYRQEDGGILLPGVEILTDYYNIPNVYYTDVQNPEQDAAYHSEYRNDDEDSPLSTVQRGRNIVAEIEGPEAVENQAQLDIWLERKAMERSMAYQTIRFSTAVMPVHQSMDRILLSTEKVQGVFVETGWSIPLTAGGAMNHTVRRTL